MITHYWRTDGPHGCSVCGKILKEGELYVEHEQTTVCSDCAEEMDICDILELLELESVIALFGKITDCVKTAF